LKPQIFNWGDKLSISTNEGAKELTVMGIVDSVPYATDESTLTTLIATEKVFQEVSDNPTYKTIDLQLSHKNEEQTISEINTMINETVTLHDKRQLNVEANKAFMTVAIFIYGFVGVIAFISILNIINTMNTSVVSRAKYLAMMRAVGMSGKQLNKMVLAQSLTYTLTGCITGSILGILLQKKLLDFLQADWSFPIYQVIGIFIICIITSLLSVMSPLKRIKEMSISENISNL